MSKDFDTNVVYLIQCYYDYFNDCTSITKQTKSEGSLLGAKIRKVANYKKMIWTKRLKMGKEGEWRNVIEHLHALFKFQNMTTQLLQILDQSSTNYMHACGSTCY